MKRHTSTIGAVAVAFALTAAPTLAQERQGGGARPSGGAQSSGTATSRGGGESGASSRSGGSESSSRGGGSSGGGMSGGSMGSSSTPSMPSSSGSGRAPSRSVERADRGASSRSGDQPSRAVPRGSSVASNGGSSAVSNGSASREVGATASTDRASGGERRAVPAFARPRDGRAVTGTAVSRGSGAVNPNNDIFLIYRPYYYPYGFWGSNYGYGLGYLYYDPFWSGAYGYGYDPYGGYGYGGGYSGYGSGGYSQSYRDTGNLRLKIKPREAQVFIDGYFVGVVDSFDGVFQRLALDGGGHKVGIKAEGYEPMEFDVLITPGETVTYKGELRPIR